MKRFHRCCYQAITRFKRQSGDFERYRDVSPTVSCRYKKLYIFFSRIVPSTAISYIFLFRVPMNSGTDGCLVNT